MTWLNSVPHPTVQLCMLILLWWLGLFASNFVIKRTLADAEESVINAYEGLTTEFLNLRWIELTTLQLIAASLLSLCVGKLTGKLAWLSSRSNTILVAAICHLVATLAASMVCTIVKSDIANLALSCLPLLTFLFITRHGTQFDFSAFLSVMYVVIGVFMFQINSNSLMFNIWGLIAGSISSLALSKRNVVLKEENCSTFEKFVATSSLSAVLSLPLLLLKAAATGTVFTGNLLRYGALGLIFTGCSLTSFKVLEMVTPVTHALVVICISLFTSVETFLTLNSDWISMNTVFSLFVILLGFALYNFISKESYIMKLFGLTLTLSCFLLLNPHYPLWSADLRAKHVPSGVKILPMSSLRRDSVTTSISTAWLFDRNVSDSVVANIEDLADNNPTTEVYVYCGTTQCIHEVASLEKENIVVGFAIISDIVKGTPLEKWAADHPKNKLLAGRDFERHIHEVAMLSILWKYGGFFINPTVHLSNKPLPKYDSSITTAVVSPEITVSSGGIPSVFAVSYFSKNHPVIKALADTYISHYPDKHPFKFDFIHAVWNTVKKVFEEVIAIQTFDFEATKYPSSTPEHYGILSHTLNPTRHLDADELENFAALQFLPFTDNILSRSNMQSFSTHSKNMTETTFFLNGRLGLPQNTEPKPGHLNPIMLSVSLEGGIKQNWSEHLSYMKAHEPVGCRDVDTLEYLQANDIKGFLGSLMLLTKNFHPQSGERTYFIIAEVKREFTALLPRRIQDSATDLLESSTSMFQILKDFSSAKLVITENAQYALACVTLDTPVIFIMTDKGPASSQFTSLFHVVNMNTMTKDQAAEWFKVFPWSQIPQNPNPALFMRLRATSWDSIRQNQHLYDTAVRFGVVPMHIPLSLQSQHRLVFYLIFSTSGDSSLSVFGSSKKVSGKFNWRHWRSVESIFYHHPTAEVKVFSNTLPENTFDVLTEAGYSIRVCRYNLEDLLKGTPAEGFIKKLPKARKGFFWYANEANLLRLLVLYKWGGIYMDTDIIVVRPLNTLKNNVLGWESDANSKGLVNGAFAKFDKGNLYLKACLNNFVLNFRYDIWGYNCPRLLTRVYKNSKWSEDVISIADYKKFYMIVGGRMNEECFEDTEGSRFEHNLQLLRDEAVVFHMNTKISGTNGLDGDHLKNGTICQHLLTSYCVLCDEIH